MVPVMAPRSVWASAAGTSKIKHAKTLTIKRMENLLVRNWPEHIGIPHHPVYGCVI
jgi:hypothetical protein